MPFGEQVIIRVGGIPNDQNVRIAIDYRNKEGSWTFLPTTLFSGQNAQQLLELQGVFLNLAPGTAIDYRILCYWEGGIVGKSRKFSFQIEAWASIRTTMRTRSTAIGADAGRMVDSLLSQHASAHPTADSPRTARPPTVDTIQPVATPSRHVSGSSHPSGGLLPTTQTSAKEPTDLAGQKRGFISYSRKDAETANRLRELLQGHIPIWIDTQDMRSGDVILAQVVEAIAVVSHLFVVVTANSISSGWVRREIGLARRRGIVLLLIAPDDSLGSDELPRFMKDRLILCMRDADFLERLLQDIRQTVRTFNLVQQRPLKEDGFVDRPRELAELKSKLLTDDLSPVAITAAMVGTGGFGKTWLATAACYDPEVEDFFFDGILWVTLGEKLDEQGILSRLGRLVQWLSQEAMPTDLVSARIRLDELLANRQILLIVDDVWRIDDLQHFLDFGGSTVRRLITTRNRNILPGNTVHVSVDIMQEEESLDVLTAHFDADDIARERAKLLAKMLGHWAMLLSLSNGRLLASTKAGHSLVSAIGLDEENLRRNGLVGFDMRNTEMRSKTPSISINLSINLLNPVERGLFLDLAVFPEDIRIPVRLIHRLWRARQEGTGWTEHHRQKLLQNLRDLSLLQYADMNDDHATIRLHDIIRTHLITLHKQALVRVHHAFLDSYRIAQGGFAFDRNFAGQEMLAGKSREELTDELRYIWRHAKHHFNGAKRIPEWCKTLLNIEFIAKRTWILNDTATCSADMNEVVQAYAFAKPANTLAEQLAWYYKQADYLLPGCEVWQEIGRILIQRLWSALPLRDIQKLADLQQFLPILVPLVPPPDQPSPENIQKQNHEGHAGWVKSCVHLGEDRFVSTSTDKTVKLWSWPGTGIPIVIATLKGHSGTVNACAKGSQGKLLTAGEEGKLLLWDLAGQKIEKYLIFHTKSVKDCAVLRDGRAVSVSEDGSVCLWNLLDSSISLFPVKVLDANPNTGAKACAVSADETRLLTGHSDGSIKLWDLTTETEIATLKDGHSKDVSDCAFLEDGNPVSVAMDGNLVIWDSQHHALMRSIRAHDKGGINGVAVFKDRIVTGHDDKKCKVWDIGTGKEVRILSGHVGEIYCCIPVGGDSILTGSEDKSMILWDLNNGSILATFNRKDGAQDCEILSDGRILVGLETGEVAILDDKARRQFTLPTHNLWLWSVNALPGNRIATGSADHTLKIWKIGKTREQSRELLALKGHTNAIWDSTVWSNGTNVRLLSCAEDGTLRCWDIDTGDELFALQAHKSGICSCTISNGHPVTGSYEAGPNDGTLKIWEMDPVTNKPTEKCHSASDQAGGVWACEALSDGRIVVGTKNKILIIFSQKGEKLWQHTGHQDCVFGCTAMKTPIPRFVSSSLDGTSKIWEFDSVTNLPRLLVTYYAEGAHYINSPYPDNKRIVIAGGHGIYLLRLIERSDRIDRSAYEER